MDAHTVAVTFEDEKTSVDAVIKVLAATGYSVPDFSESQSRRESTRHSAASH